MQRFIAEVERTGKLPALAKDTSDALRDNGPGWTVSVEQAAAGEHDHVSRGSDRFAAKLLVTLSNNCRRLAFCSHSARRE